MTQTLTHDRHAVLRQSITEHVARYRMTVPEALAQQPLFQRRSRKAIQRLLGELCREKQLAHAALYHNRRYYYLPVRDAAPCGPLSEPAKIRAYAMLSFCCLGPQRRQRLSAAEIEAHFPDLYRPGLPGGYYVAAGDPPRFGLAVPDAGGRGRWDRVLARVRQQLYEHQRHPSLRPFIEQDRFELTIVTALPQKAQRLASTIAQWREPAAQLIRVAVIPELLHLIAPAPRRSS